MVLQQVQGFAARRSTKILRCVIPGQLVEVRITRVRTRHEHGTETAIHRVARIKWQRAIVLRLHVAGVYVSVLRGRRRWRSLSLHRRFYAFLFALRVVALAEVLRLLLFRLMLRTRRWHLRLGLFARLFLPPLLTGIQIVSSVVLNRTWWRWRRRSLTLRAVINVIRAHLALHFYTLLEYLMILMLLVLQTRL